MVRSRLARLLNDLDASNLRLLHVITRTSIFENYSRSYPRNILIRALKLTNADVWRALDGYPCSLCARCARCKRVRNQRH
jgi:hypothetical protein